MSKLKNIKIIIATHKKYKMPTESMYIPLQVGAEGKEDLGYAKDNEGDNISAKNPYYCELTGLYWAWKNLECDYLGLAHYRRHYKNGLRIFKSKFKNILTQKKLEKLLKKNDIILPKKRRYYIENNKSQYLHAHHAEGLLNTEKVIKDYYPDYLDAWNTMLKKRSGHRFNMFIMKKELAEQYCQWLFELLFKVEESMDIKDWSKSEQRVYGYLSERLLDVWLIKNGLKVKNISYIFMEKQNWLKKIFKFIKRKFIRHAYD